ncbi:hypothetical protein GCM10010987_23100 [Bradyrhizobium guangdongense]|uniref:Uncharacterized protein n=1 Tax=Bradyrhizobium guangdongense TaxID=1325090 RepID=A0AA88B7Z2_9BRAD|nr:hypothetical protein GCM10010987_23100 [Bradyrhizobium guangdongense]
MPVKPSTPATIEISRKISAHFKIVIASSAYRRPQPAAPHLFGDANGLMGNWFLQADG